ncbi:PucR family transcriptional regulator [Haloechinothrix halophila]|uniref:PucR family transcriptional regulator n=1 Tax=Haloechinothrix halophila TaxID=1069073 RepID=UPI0012F990D1|nr:helix-turn-helix domain-containing protein [Haloechinothrix halophila]
MTNLVASPDVPSARAGTEDAARTGEQLRRVLPREMVRGFRPHARRLAQSIITGVRQSVPEYTEPLDGPFAEVLIAAAQSVILRGIDAILEPKTSSDDWTPLFRSIGTIECGQGRSVDALRAAYRVAASVTKQYVTRYARHYGVATEMLTSLSAIIDAQCERLCVLAAEGHANAESGISGQAARRRERVLHLLLAEPVPDIAAATEEARTLRWPMPDTLAAVALRRTDHADTADASYGDLGESVLADLHGPRPCLLVAADDPVLADLPRRLPGWQAAIGPAAPLTDVRSSLHVAHRALDLAERGMLPAEHVIDCAEHRTTLMLFADDLLIDNLVERRLAPLAPLTERQQERLLVTLQQWLATRGHAGEIAQRLAIHPQTVRYRVNKLQQLFGEQLTDPQSRFELALATRVRLLRSGALPARSPDFVAE